MAHPEQMEYCERIKNTFPTYFKNIRVLDVGSLDINGCNKPLFDNCDYTGLDIGEGNNVDVVCKAHEYDGATGSYATIISTEMFEHDKFLSLTLPNLIRMLANGGLFIFSCATIGRAEHGTKRSETEWASPLTSSSEEWEDYYKNLTEEDIRAILPIDDIFMEYEFDVLGFDLRFWGIKKVISS